MKYRVMSDTMNQFNDIEVDYVIDDFTIGRNLIFLGEDYVLKQNGKILVLGNKNRVITIMDVTPEAVEEKKKLIINDNFEIFFETKEVEVKIDCTYEELFDSLNMEWGMIKELVGISFPFEYNTELKLFTFNDEWDFSTNSFSHMKDGSFSRKTAYGNNI